MEPTKSDRHLKKYLRNNFSFSVLKQAGFYGKDIKANDYEAQAKRICERFSLKNIYDYSSIGVGTRYHLTGEDVTSLSFANTIKNNFGNEILKTLNL